MKTSHGSGSIRKLEAKMAAAGAAGFEAIYEDVRRLGIAIFRRLSPTDADDLAQDFCIRVWQRLTRGESLASAIRHAQSLVRDRVMSRGKRGPDGKRVRIVRDKLVVSLGDHQPPSPLSRSWNTEILGLESGECHTVFNRIPSTGRFAQVGTTNLIDDKPDGLLRSAEMADHAADAHAHRRAWLSAIRACWKNCDPERKRATWRAYCRVVTGNPLDHETRLTAHSLMAELSSR